MLKQKKTSKNDHAMNTSNAQEKKGKQRTQQSEKQEERQRKNTVTAEK